MNSPTEVRKEMEAVYTLHQEAVQLFEQGRIESSRQIFTDAFAAMNRMLHQTKRPDAFYFKGSPLVRSNQESPEFSKPLDLHDVQICENDEESEKATIGPLNMLSTASDIPIHYRVLKLPELSTVNQFAFVTLYNLALSTHLSALMLAGSPGEIRPTNHEHSSSVSMQTAAKLWELVYSFQWRPALNLKPIHALAVLVNLGHAQCVVGNSAGSKKCFENILSAIQILEGRNHSVPNRSFFVYSAFRMLSGNNPVSTASAA